MIKGMEREGKGREGKGREGKERKGKERKGKERKEKERKSMAVVTSHKTRPMSPSCRLIPFPFLSLLPLFLKTTSTNSFITIVIAVF
jgi:hypothetical protein